MSDKTPPLLRSRRFLPLFITQFLGALNDNLFKNAMVILILFRLAADGEGQLLVTLAGGIFILPFFLFSALAGQMADKFEKSMLIRRIKLAEIAIMVLGTGALYLGNSHVLLAILFVMGAQSAFFGPLKYAILPDHLHPEELAAGNGLIEAATFIAILLGTIAGGLLILRDGGLAMVSVCVLALAVLGWLTSRAIPPTTPTGRDIRLNPNLAAETNALLNHARETPLLFSALLGISWFWLVGATFLTQFPNLAKGVLGGNEEVVTLLLTCFAIGIAIGSIGCSSLLKGQVSTRWVAWAGMAITVLTIDFYIAISDRTATGPTIGAATFLAEPANWRVLFDLVAIAIAGGLYSVPLYTTLLQQSRPDYRARNIASANILSSLFMVGGALWASVMLITDFTVPEILLSVAVANGLAAVYAWKKLPRT